MAKTTKKRSHDNNEARKLADERAARVTNWWVDRGCILPSVKLQKRISRALQAHARATLDRAKRRGG